VVNIRLFESKDIEALYAISLGTGLAGGDASSLYADRKLMGHIYSAPYAVLEPALCLVTEDEEGVAGFAVGAVDTRSWEDRLEAEWWPSLRRQYAAPDEARMAEWTPDQRRIGMIHDPARTPAAVVGRYPSHLHMNLLPRLQRRGIGRRLFESWLSLAAGRGAEALHVGVNRANGRAVRFWRKLDFVELAFEGASEGRTVWMGRRTVAAHREPVP
jgi:ribosomal protein S18 acetylase RimI-like enzyme